MAVEYAELSNETTLGTRSDRDIVEKVVEILGCEGLENIGGWDAC